MAREKDEAYTSQPILDVFKEIGEQGDKRDSRGLRHPMYCILVLVLLGFLFGCTSYREMYRFFQPEDPTQRAAILAQLQTFLNLEHGIPHYSTISRALAQLDPDVLVTMVAELIGSLLPAQENGEKIHICLDGKSIRAAVSRPRTGNNLYKNPSLHSGYGSAII